MKSVVKWVRLKTVRRLTVVWAWLAMCGAFDSVECHVTELGDQCINAVRCEYTL